MTTTAPPDAFSTEEHELCELLIRAEETGDLEAQREAEFFLDELRSRTQQDADAAIARCLLQAEREELEREHAAATASGNSESAIQHQQGAADLAEIEADILSITQRGGSEAPPSPKTKRFVTVRVEGTGSTRRPRLSIARRLIAGILGS